MGAASVFKLLAVEGNSEFYSAALLLLELIIRHCEIRLLRFERGVSNVSSRSEVSDAHDQAEDGNVELRAPCTPQP